MLRSNEIVEIKLGNSEILGSLIIGFEYSSLHINISDIYLCIYISIYIIIIIIIIIIIDIEYRRFTVFFIL